jgi:hypothetical protein
MPMMNCNFRPMISLIKIGLDFGMPLSLFFRAIGEYNNLLPFSRTYFYVVFKFLYFPLRFFIASQK